MKNKNSFLNWVSNLIFPQHIKCIFCERELNIKTPIETCEKCYDKLPLKNGYNLCEKCGDEVVGMGNVCLVCKSEVRYFEKAISPMFYKKPINQAIRKMKYSNAKYLFQPLAAYLAKEYYKYDFDLDFVVFVPMCVQSLKERGYNQSQLLAEEFAKITNLTVLGGVVEKIKKSRRQAELDLHQRHKNIKGTFKVFGKDIIKGKKLLLIDDVLTSGATASEISKVLLKAGAEKVFVLTLARTHFHESEQKDF
jgi:ComF family protein